MAQRERLAVGRQQLEAFGPSTLGLSVHNIICSRETPVTIISRHCFGLFILFGCGFVADIRQSDSSIHKISISILSVHDGIQPV